MPSWQPWLLPAAHTPPIFCQAPYLHLLIVQYSSLVAHCAPNCLAKLRGWSTWEMHQLGVGWDRIFMAAADWRLVGESDAEPWRWRPADVAKAELIPFATYTAPHLTAPSSLLSSSPLLLFPIPIHGTASPAEELPNVFLLPSTAICHPPWQALSFLK